MIVPENIRPKPVGIKDVAAAAQVSLATVSLVLNGKGNFPEKTQEHVRKVASELGYVPNRKASMLRSGNSKTLGFILGESHDPEWAQQWAEMTGRLLFESVQVAGLRNYAIIAIPADSDLIRSFGIDGLILSDSRNEDPDLDAATKLGIPILTNERPDDSRVSVHLDSGYRGMTIAAFDALVASGAHKPGLLTEPLGLASNELPEHTYISWCEQRGLTPVVARGKHDRSDIEEQVTFLLNQGCDAIYSFYEEGETVLNIVRSAGKSVPEDVQLIAASAYNDDRNKELGISSTVYHPEDMIVGTINALIDVVEGIAEAPVTVTSRWEMNLYSSTRMH
ncbi:LacI family DNA-binding transcriptional regulator [uncultured Aurantimicrobium sp.]|uniref:LacI family DNA-binding transcriptional regulator n=1 Tax=uncultured Aurantimicrobium sp. TaxID=1705357 RepID=UPI0026229DD1|nr:LacI family DNA-binding transcriptional regulator [uncultured Aurantimicrobium sp.]